MVHLVNDFIIIMLALYFIVLLRAYMAVSALPRLHSSGLNY